MDTGQRRQQRSTRFLLHLLVMGLAAGLCLPATPATAGQTDPGGPQDQPVLVADPPVLSAQLRLGEQQTLTVRLVNQSNTPQEPALYEARPAAPLPQGRTGAPTRVELPQQRERIDRRLLEQLRDPQAQTDFLIVLREQADLSPAYRITDWGERGRAVYRILSDWAEQHQRELRRDLEARGVPHRPFWIVNAVLAHGRRADVEAAAARAEVALVRANPSRRLPASGQSAQNIDERCSPDEPSNPVCWNIRAIGSDVVWRTFGVTGRGVLVGGIDSGANLAHPALAGQYRGALGGEQLDHDYSWFDPSGQMTQPGDTTGHGSHTLGTVVGSGDAAEGRPAVGVAPGARWIAARGCYDIGCSDADLIASAQWMLAPTRLDQSDPRPDLRPMIINNSWGGAGGDPWYTGYIAAWRAAGIFPVFAAGNADINAPQVCGSIGSPGDDPLAVAVGAVDAQQQLASFSLIGPAQGGRLKPDFSAPGLYNEGLGVLSSGPAGGGYQALQGTSMAAPHVAGVVALLWSANPALIGDFDATYALLRQTAQSLDDARCGDAPGGPNNLYGHGMVDAYAAVSQARVDLPWLTAQLPTGMLDSGEEHSVAVTLDARRVPGPGRYQARLLVFPGDLGQPPVTVNVQLEVTPAPSQTVVRGRVVSVESGSPLQALVSADGGLPVSTDAAGYYTLTLTLDRHELTAHAPAYLPAARSITPGATPTQADFALAPDQPRLALETTALSGSVALGQHGTAELRLRNTGTRPLRYWLRLPEEPVALWRDDEPDGPRYQWVDLPPDAASLPLDGDEQARTIGLDFGFPFMGGVYQRVTVGSDGTLAFVPPGPQPVRACVPTGGLGVLLIAPFRADFDPALGGRIAYAARNDHLVVSFEDLRRAAGPPGARYSFQALLYRDGRIVFQYRQIMPLPETLRVGVQGRMGERLLVGCGSETPVRNIQALELRPQPPAPLWLAIDAPEGEVPPGAEQAIPLSLHWLRPAGGRPYRATLILSSSDPLRRSAIVPFNLQPLPPPHSFWLPVIRG
ncbi:MAG TPA: S8 family serine peptidase [Roseiflexaceae bacterium]|nr:S8 family serine peptidase [Roseiflexaceae bacterium]